MAAGKQTPRQKMINMMYLVLTALLALNVSKEVLNSFFEVNKGIERTTTNFDLKNGDTYAEFDNAAMNNPEKYKEVRDKAHDLKLKADQLVDSLQKMKYDLVFSTDGEVYLGSEQEITSEDGDLIQDKAFVKPWSQLNSKQKKIVLNSPIGHLNAKDNRDQAGSLFYNVKKAALKGGDTPATSRKKEMESLKSLLISLSGDNIRLVNSVNETFNLDDRKQRDGKIIAWEYHNFYDMPAVGALTLLSKMQSDIRNTEANVIDYLKKDIDAKSLKFGDAEAVEIPKSNFILKGDSFRSTIFIAAKQEGQEPEIFVGEYDSLGDGNYEMKGDYETVNVINGKGLYTTKTRSEGQKKWGGLIVMKTETGNKYYPFNGEYLVASRTAVVSPTKMNILYYGLEQIGGNPVQVSVPGYPAGEITPRMTNGKIRPVKKSEGMYVCMPSKNAREAVITLYANVDGKQKSMGKVEFRVKKTPPPTPLIGSVKKGLISKNVLKEEIVRAELKDFLFDGLRYAVTSFKMTGYINGAPATAMQNNGMGFTKDQKRIIANAAKGSDITITQIYAKLTPGQSDPVPLPTALVFKLK